MPGRSAESDSAPGRVPDGARIRAGIIDFLGLFIVVAVIVDALSAGNQARLYAGLGLTIALNVLYHGAMERERPRAAAVIAGAQRPAPRGPAVRSRSLRAGRLLPVRDR